MNRILLLLFYTVVHISSSIHAVEPHQLCEGLIAEGSFYKIKKIDYSNTKPTDYINQIRKIKSSSITEQEKADLDIISNAIGKNPTHLNIFHSHIFTTNFYSEDLIKYWDGLAVNINLTMNHQAQEVYAAHDGGMTFAGLLRKPNTYGVEYVLIDMSFVRESQPGTGMGQVMHSCYCYAGKSTVSGTVNCSHQ